jgi:hypothetical protein
MEDWFFLAVAVGLSAACGLRVFVPPMMLSGASVFGGMDVPLPLEWLENPLVFGALAAATFIEVIGYYIPWLDNALDTVATPAALAAGVIISRAYLGEVADDPFAQWALAAIVGGGGAGSTQLLSSVTRLSSTALTGGLGNPVVSTTENIGSVVMTFLALLAPFLAFVVVVALLVSAVRRLRRYRRRRADAASP